MEFPFFFEQISSLSEEDYEKIGFAGNPAYYGLHRAEVTSAHIPREPLESELKSVIDAFFGGDDFKHAYLYSGPPGTGKSHTLEVLRNHCSEMNIPYVELRQDDSESLDMLSYMMELSEANGVVLFCDCQTKFYEKLIKLGKVCIIGTGHAPRQELGSVVDEFKVFDLERDYPLSADDIYALLTATLQKISLETAASIPDSFLKKVSQMTNNPGLALDTLGACLAILAYKAKTGQCPEVTQEDIRYCCDKQFVRWLSGFRKLPVQHGG